MWLPMLPAEARLLADEVSLEKQTEPGDQVVVLFPGVCKSFHQSDI